MCDVARLEREFYEQTPDAVLRDLTEVVEPCLRGADPLRHALLLEQLKESLEQGAER